MKGRRGNVTDGDIVLLVLWWYVGDKGGRERAEIHSAGYARDETGRLVWEKTILEGFGTMAEAMMVLSLRFPNLEEILQWDNISSFPPAWFDDLEAAEDERDSAGFRSMIVRWKAGEEIPREVEP